MSIEKDNIEERVIQKLKTIKDLELPVNIYDLGLIYKTEVEVVDENININIETTSIDSRCNKTVSFTEELINHVKSVDGVDNCNVKFVDSPKWDTSMISALGLEQLKNANSKEAY